VDDPNVEVVDARDHAGAGPRPTDSDLVEVTGVAPGDVACRVDDVVSDAVVAVAGGVAG
jgi:hypothetical protein